MKKNLILVVVSFALLTLGILIFRDSGFGRQPDQKLNAPRTTIGTSNTSSVTTNNISGLQEKEALERLRRSVANVAPHFINQPESDSVQSLSEQDQKIKDAIVALRDVLEPEGHGYHTNIILRGVGAQYILITQPSGGGSHDEVVDSQTGKSTFIPGSGVAYYITSEERKIALYIDDRAIRTYTLDQPDVVLVLGSQLSGTETYHSGTGDMPALIPYQTHTKNSITISVFDATQMVQNPDAQPSAMQTMNKKIRDLTLLF